MSSTSNSKMLIACALFFSLALPSIALCEGNPRQAEVQGARGGSDIGNVEIITHNTVNGKIRADNNSHVTVGDVTVSNTEANKLEILSKNETAAIIAKDNSTVAIGSTNISNLKADTVDVTTINTVKGKIKATKHSSASVGNVNIQ